MLSMRSDSFSPFSCLSTYTAPARARLRTRPITLAQSVLPSQKRSYDWPVRKARRMPRMPPESSNGTIRSKFMNTVGGAMLSRLKTKETCGHT